MRVWARESSLSVLEHIFQNCLGEFQSFPSLLARKHASDLTAARLSLFLSPKLALSYLISSGLLKTVVRRSRQEHRMHGICSGRVPAVQVSSVESKMPSAFCVYLRTSEFLHGLGMLFQSSVSFLLSWQEIYITE